MDYLRDPSAIYAKSFAIIDAEAEFAGVPEDARKIAARVVHACGMVEIAPELVISSGFAAAAISALKARRPIITDSEMVRHGIMTSLLPPGIETICTLNNPRAREIGLSNRTTRSAAAVELWKPHIAGAIAVIGNAPTALFALLENIDAGWPEPAAIVAFPVGFVGAAEAKRELVDNPRDIPFITLPGRRGGSAMAASVINALLEGLRS
jgi:precorrin-8X/cobalt-precorrin-8 methylmutase